MNLLAGGFGSLAFLAYALLAILVAAGRLVPLPGLKALYLLAALAAAVSGLVAALTDPVTARPAAFVEALLWVALLAFAGRHLKDRGAKIAVGLALVLTVATVLVAPADPWLMALAASAIIGLFLATAQAGSGGLGLPLGQRLTLLALAAGFVFDLVLAALALAGAPLQPAVETVRPLLRTLMVPLLALGIAGLPAPGSGAALDPGARRMALVVVATAIALLLTAAATVWLGTALGAVLGLALGLPLTIAILATALHPDAGQRLEAWLGRRWPRHRYDYREVWPQFVDVLSGTDPRPSDDLPERVIRAVAGTMGARGGASGSPRATTATGGWSCTACHRCRARRAPSPASPRHSWQATQHWPPPAERASRTCARPVSWPMPGPQPSPGPASCPRERRSG
jgi:hypothetical protein